LFITISPNPSTKHSITKRKGKKLVSAMMPYGKLPQKVQHEYCLKVLKEFIYSPQTQIVGVWELNGSDNVHFHFIMSDPNIKNKTQLAMFRRDILNCEIVFKNLSKKMIDYMNNIVYVNDSVEARYKYMTKEMEMNLPIMPYYSFNAPLL
jgi:Holliday junction resolvase RusA-like endonuclease